MTRGAAEDGRGEGGVGGTPGNEPEGWFAGGVLRNGLKAAAFGAIVAAAIWTNLYGAQMAGVEETVSSWGFVGLFLVSALSGFNVVVPIPIILFFPFFTEIGMHPGATVLTIAVGMTAGDLGGFLIGFVGRQVVHVPEGRILRALRGLRERRWLPYAVLFGYASVVPLPNELMVIPMAFLGFSLVGVFGATLLGNVIFNAVAALSLTGVFGSG